MYRAVKFKNISYDTFFMLVYYYKSVLFYSILY